jgi:hypothetical protein
VSRAPAVQPVFDAVIDRLAGSSRTWPGGSRCGATGTPVPLWTLHRLDPLARHQRLAPLHRRARKQRLCRAVHPHPQRAAVPVGQALRHHRRTAPGCRRVHPPLYHRMAHRTARSTHPTRSPRRRPDLSPSRVIDNRRVQRTGCCSRMVMHRPVQVDPRGTAPHRAAPRGTARPRSCPVAHCDAGEGASWQGGGAG